MKKLLLAIFIAGIIITNLFAQFNTDWQRSIAGSNLPSWFSSSGNTERGFAYGYTNNGSSIFNHRVFVVSRNGGNSIKILSASDGSDVGTLSLGTGIVSGGTFSVNDVEVSEDGQIFVCNLTSTANTSAFKVYRWSDESTTPVVALNTTISDAVRLGDVFTVTGKFSDNSAIIWAASATQNFHKVYKWSMSAGSFNSTPEVISCSDALTGTIPVAAIAPLSNGGFYWNAGGQQAAKYNSSGTLIGKIPSGVIPTGTNSIKYIGSIGSDEYIVTFQYGTSNHNGILVRVPGGVPANAVAYGTTSTLGNTANSGGTGDVSIKLNDNGTRTVFVLATNNGVGSYTTTTGSIGWGNIQSPATASITTLESVTVYGQVWVDGVTNPAGQGAGIGAWLGYSTSNTNPNTWTNWIPATFNVQSGNNDEYKATLSNLSAGTYYYAYRYQNQLGQYYYGGTGGQWDNSSGVLTVTAPPTTFDFINLQYPSSGAITTLQSFDVYAQAYIAGVTDPAGQAAGVSCWIGYSTENTNPNTWTNWISAPFSSQQGNNDEYKGTLTGLGVGTYYYASRFQRNSGDYYYGGYSTNGGGTWDGTTNVSGTLTVTVPPTTINWANLSSPASGSIHTLQTLDVYGQVYVEGVTTGAGQASGITCWIGYSTENTNPSGWTNWVSASYTGDVGNNDQYKGTLSSLSVGTYYYATRWQRNNGDYYYGGYSSGGGGFWDGTTYVSGTLTVTAPPTNIDFINLQYPGSGSITAASTFDVYAQIYIAGVTNPAGQASGISCWIGYSTENTDPSTWTNWVSANYFGDAGINNNNDEYKAVLSLGKGTYYYASRFQRNGGDYYYGGYSTNGGGTWNGTTNISGTLNVSGLTGTYYVGNAGTKPGGGNPDFATLKAACDNLNANIVDGNVTYLITSDLTEASNIALGKNPGSYTITFKPYTGLQPTVTYTQTADNAGTSGAWVIGQTSLASGAPMVATSNIIIDGSNTNGGTTRDLIFNSSAGTSAYPFRIRGNCDNITIKNCVITAGKSDINYAISITPVFESSTNYNPDNMTIENCSITATASSSGATIFLLRSGTTTEAMENFIVKNNLLYARTRAIYLSGYTNVTTIEGNIIEINQTSGGFTSTAVEGASIFGTGVTYILKNNFRKNSTANTTAGYGIRTIVASGGGTWKISNNMFGGYSAPNASGAASEMIAIRCGSTVEAYYNTILMNNINATTGTLYRGIWVAAGSPILKNNIIVSEEDDFVNHCIYNSPGTSDYNNLFRTGIVNAKVGYFNGDIATLNDWKTATGKDANSISSDPLFHNPSNLHVLPVSPVAGAGTPVEGYTTDYDGQLRNATNPSIGADEVAAVNQSSSGSAANPVASTENPVIALASAGGMTFNPTTTLTGDVRGYFFTNGRSGTAPAGVTNIADYFWSVSTNVPSFIGSARFYFDQIPGNGVSSPSTLKLLKRDNDGSPWVEYTDVTRGDNYIQANGLTSFSDFTFGGGNDNPLPVEITTFSGKAMKNTVVLKWATATEVENYGFEIQRTTSPRPSPYKGEGVEGNWEVIGFVPGNGNSNSEKSYSFTDRNIVAGTKYVYRLKQIDTDGSFEYSKEIEVIAGVPDKYELLQNHPNPFNPATSISYTLPVESRVTLAVYSMNGEKVAELVNDTQPAGSYSVPFDASKLASGTYMYRITANDFIQVRKMLLVK